MGLNLIHCVIVNCIVLGSFSVLGLLIWEAKLVA